MTRAGALFAHDVRLQYRNRIYHAYAFVVAVYVALLLLIGSSLPEWVPALVLFSDPAVIGFYFIGALMLLEKSEGARAALGATPVGGAEYFAAKAATLTLFAVFAVATIALFVADPVRWPLLLAGTALISVHYLGLGVLAAMHFRTVTGYLMGSAAVLTPYVAPGFMAFLDPMPLAVLLIPAAAQMRLMLIATSAVPGSATEMAIAVAISLVAALAGIWVAVVALRADFGAK